MRVGEGGVRVGGRCESGGGGKCERGGRCESGGGGRV